MSIASELSALNGYILGAYDEINDKGGTVPANKNMANLASAISSIEGGGGGVGIPREVDANGVYGMPTQDFTFSLPANAINVASYGLYNVFSSCTTLTSVDLSSLTTLSNSYALGSAFNGCNRLTSADLSSLTTVSGNQALGSTFSGCSSLTSVNLSSLTTVSNSNALYSAFSRCASLTSVNLGSLTTVGGSSALGSIFSGCTGLTSVNLDSLATINGGSALSSAFSGCTRLASLSFPSLTASSFGSYVNQFNNMLRSVRDCTLHFPASTQAKIEAMTGYPNFGGTNTTVLFDL